MGVPRNDNSQRQDTSMSFGDANFKDKGIHIFFDRHRVTYIISPSCLS